MKTPCSPKSQANACDPNSTLETQIHHEIAHLKARLGLQEREVFPLPGLAGWTAVTQREFIEFVAHQIYAHRSVLIERARDQKISKPERIALLHALVIVETVVQKSGSATDIDEDQDARFASGRSPIQKLAWETC